jgi:hypothetical protein
MRPSCLDCVRKHLAQALVLMSEVKKGYPEHFWLVIGHMAEAEDEMLEYSVDFANRIREERVRYQLNIDYVVPIMSLIEDVGKLEKVTKPSRTQATIVEEQKHKKLTS